MEEHTSFRRGEQADRGGEGCEDGRGDGVLLSDGQHPPPWDQPQQLQVSLPFPSTHPLKSLSPKLAPFYIVNTKSSGIVGWKGGWRRQR